MEWMQTPCSVPLGSHNASSGLNDEQDLGKKGLRCAADSSFVTALDKGCLRLFSAVERGRRQCKTDAQASLLDSDARLLMSSKLGFAQMSRTRLSVSCVGTQMW